MALELLIGTGVAKTSEITTRTDANSRTAVELPVLDSLLSSYFSPAPTGLHTTLTYCEGH